MAQWLRALAALPGDQMSCLSSHKAAHNCYNASLMVTHNRRSQAPVHTCTQMHVHAGEIEIQSERNREVEDVQTQNQNKG